MAKDIIKSGSTPLSSFEEFEKYVNSLNDNGNLLDKPADLYIKLPALLRTLTNIEPTGIASALAQLLEENKVKREQRNVLLAMFELAKVLSQCGHRIEQLEKSYLSTEFPKLTIMYFEHSKQTFDVSKIHLFRNIWVNGLLANERSSSEKSIIFNIIQSLSEDEINALRFIYDASKDSEARKTAHIHVDEVAKSLDIEPSYAQQLCVRLRAQGLIGESSTGWTIGSGPPVTFMLMDFTNTVIEYIRDFSQEQPHNTP